MTTTLDPYGFSVEHQNVLEISEGIHPRISLKAAPWLPIQTVKTARDAAYIVVEKGEFVSTYYDSSDDEVYLVPANGGLASTSVGYAACPARLQYTALDVGKTINQATGSVVTTSELTGTSGYVQLPANAPIGYAFVDYYMDLAHLYRNYQLQTQKKPISSDWYVEYPCISAKQRDNASVGDLVIPDIANPGAWAPLDSNEITSLASAGVLSSATQPTIDGTILVLNQVVGKIFKKEKITDIDNLALETTYPGLNLAGSGTSGIAGHLLNATEDSSGDKWRVQINIGAFCS